MTLTNKTIMAPINSIYDDDIEERIERRTRIVQDAYSKAKEAEAEQEASIIRRINTLEYDATCTRARVNERRGFGSAGHKENNDAERDIDFETRRRDYEHGHVFGSRSE